MDRTRPLAMRPLTVCALLAALAIAPASSAQDAPPQPNRSLTGISPVAGYALMALAAAAIIGVSLMPAKRGHQD